MNDEIKEILDKPKILMLSYGNYISLNDYVKLKDFITNLQQENEKLTQGVTLLTNKIIDMTEAKENYKLKGDDEK